MAKLEDFSRATLYSACLPGWLSMRVKSESEQHVPESFAYRGDQKCFCCLPETLASNFVARYKVSEMAKLGDTGGGTSMSRATCLLI